MHKAGFKSLALTILLSVVTTSAAKAEIFNVCSIKETRDGFAALRAQPKTDSRMITRMRPGEVIVIEKKGNRLVSSGSWYRIEHFHGEAMPNPGDANYDKVNRGWIHQSLVDDCG